MADGKQPVPAQMEFFAIPSPCIGVCESGPRGYCLGCYRSREERLYWMQIDDATRRKVIAACRRRKQQAKRRKIQSQQVAEPTLPSQPDLFEE